MKRRAAASGLHVCRIALLAGALALGGCMTRPGGDVTGSIAPQRTLSKADWKAEADTYGARYEANPGDATAALRYASALRALDQKPQALAILQTAVLKNQNNLELLGAYGRTLADLGRLKEAQEVLGRAHTPERPDWRILSVQGTVSDQLGEHDQARKYYEAALKLAPGEPSVLSNLGLSYALSKQLPQAEQALRDAAQNPRADARVRQNLVLVLGLQGRFGEAEEIARQDQSPREAAATVADLKRMVSQPNSWDMLRNGGKPAPRKQKAADGAKEAPRG